ncbi:hypothetical protein E1B28_002722 [Marasmius oreades]|uniref:Uncharacterized protein n=1 Tax=Marasmius oreades TaxID=181124 RepID=A0A9P7UP84_9AGAR|nr:uncharacterized protein E1B28_002722 [Marasmius oreades]KAG7086794.1 hypothetical protein E1B28_002722 [Marasmius oreades]
MFHIQSGPVCVSPVTPHTNRTRSLNQNDTYGYRPLNSSPLASFGNDSSPAGPSSSPIQQAQARRRSQYKSKMRTSSGVGPSQSLSPTMSMSLSSETGSILREKFRSSCLKRAKNARKKLVKSRRRLDPMSSSDGFEADESMAMDDEDDSEAEDEFDDEVLRRVMLNDNRKLRHKYRLSYYASCGDSFDPDLEDLDQWETELHEEPEGTKSQTTVAGESQLTPEDLEDAELEAYAEECERQAALAEFENIPVEDLFGWDEDDFDFETNDKNTVSSSQDIDMDL